MVLEERMTWAVHVKNILFKCDKVLNTMRSLAGCDWRAERGSMHLVYQAMIRSSIDYGLGALFMVLRPSRC